MQCQLPLHVRMWDGMNFFLYLLNFLAPFPPFFGNCYTYGGETWSVTLRKQNGLIVLRNRVLSRMVRPIRNSVISG